MSDKLNFSSETLTRLPSYSLLTLEGPDAMAFIQAQSMNDVKALADGQWQWNGLLNPKGRLIALFALIRLRTDLIYLLSPDFPAEKLAMHLQRFVFRSKVKLVADTRIVFAAEFDAPASAERNLASRHAGESICLDFSSDTTLRKLWLIPDSHALDILADAGREARWRDLDIWHGLPRLREEQAEQWTPQMLSLGNLHAFSLKKGCYPGQEIVARTHYLGQAKRHVGLVRSTGLEVAMPVYREGEKIGEIICIDSTGDVALALLQSTSATDRLECNGKALESLQALTGLQRSI